MSLLKSALPVRNSLSLKAIVIGVLILIFMIPVGMVSSIIQERQFRQQDAMREVGSSWGNPQTITGPILAVPYHPFGQDGKIDFGATHYAYFLPENIDVSGTITTQIRSRGIYDVPVYNTSLTIKGNFTPPEISIRSNQMVWEQSRLLLGIPDLRGVSEAIPIQWNQQEHSFQPGVIGTVLPTGVSTRVPGVTAGGTFQIKLNLRGSDQLMVTPIGKIMTASLKGDWASPSFTGAFLPTERTVEKDGFTAKWKVLDLNRTTPQVWTSNEPVVLGSISPSDPYMINDPYNKRVMMNSAGDTFGVRLLLPVDIYQKSIRSAKYGIAVIALVFVMIFFVEMAARRRVHPVQYTLIGLALVIYYTLLLSLAEHLRFGFAYLIASLATIGLITLFMKSVMESRSRALMTGSILTVFYGFIYILLQLEDYALLLGSAALFGILAIIMFLSRKIDWYGEPTSSEEQVSL